MVHLFEKVKSLFDAYLLIGGLDMASIFFNGEKAEKQTAINEMLVHISNYFDGRFEVIVNSDDTGTHLEVQVEMDDVNSHIESQHPDFPFYEVWPKWMGWRTLVMKVPSGYIDAITNGVELDDY
jgi:hypothetical protein|tara:strand:- start:85 stop:456 length:372 start_codon:yes stop_codon:yes gene_type:complete